MLIILEGPDGSGKSTLARKLAKRISRPSARVNVLHAKPPKGHPIDEYAKPLYAYRPGRDVHIICDRWHLGELVYPKIANRPSQYSWAVHLWVEKFLASRGAVLVSMRLSDKELTQRLALRGGDKMFSLPQIKAANRTYSQAWSLSIMPQFVVGLNGSDLMIDHIVERAQYHEKTASAYNDFTTFVGRPRDRYLLVGDVRGEGNTDQLAPAFGPYPTSSGHYLLMNMTFAAGTSSAIANANDVDDISKIYKVQRPLGVVALGDKADHTLTYAGIPHGKVPHPQYWRRFHYAEGERYGRMINEALLEIH